MDLLPTSTIHSADDWGDAFEHAPRIAVEYAAWLSIPSFQRRNSTVGTREDFADTHGSTPEALRRLRAHPEFKRLRESMGDGLFSAETLELVYEELENVALSANTGVKERLSAIQLILKASGRLDGPSAPGVAIQINNATQARTEDNAAKVELERIKAERALYDDLKQKAIDSPPVLVLGSRQSAHPLDQDDA